MSNGVRGRSEGDFYHVIVRGVGQQIIFEDDRDRDHFLELFNKKMKRFGASVLAWCLMSNHVHLLLQVPIASLSVAMQQLESEYALYFNARHDRRGTLFQGRYSSVPVTSDEQLLAAARYIHLNPPRAHEPIDTTWSSYGEYLGREMPACVNTSLLSDMLGGREAFVAFHLAGNDDYGNCLPRHYLSEAEALHVAKRVLGEVNVYDVRTLEKSKRDGLIVKLKESGLSVRQICRITSIGQGIVSRARCNKTSEVL